MILDSLANAQRYFALNRGFAKGFAFLEQPGLAGLADGRYPVDGDRVYTVVARGVGRGRRNAKLECHRRYIDIQFAVAGIDVIGWSPTSACVKFEAPFNVEKDCGLYTARPQVWADLPPGTFMVFFPEDAHAPLAGQGAVHKVIVKVAVE